MHMQEPAARWLFTIGDANPERFLEAKTLVYQAAHAGALHRSRTDGNRNSPNESDYLHARDQAEAGRLHDAEMVQIVEQHPDLFMTIMHCPGELMIVPPGAAHAVVNLRCCRVC